MHRLFLVAIALPVILGCARDPVDNGVAERPELPELQPIAGVRDLWAFPFPLNATRVQVESTYGAPSEIAAVDSGGGPTGSVVEWRYPGLLLRFFLRADVDEEYLISAQVVDATAPMNGPVQLGTPVAEVLSLLGSPSVESASELVYFFEETTIEFAYADGLVTGVTLARALP